MDEKRQQSGKKNRIMKGLEISEKYFEEYGRPMLEQQFPELLPYLAAGLVGSGSECFGFDDEISRDHDFEPGFCIFLPGEDIIDKKQAFQLERAYSRLPKEFEGLKKSMMAPVGGNRHGIIRIGDFYMDKAGIDAEKIIKGPGLDFSDWFHIPGYALAESINGKVFMDNYGEFTMVRKTLCNMPEDVRRKAIAGNLLLMAQAGQYNYPRIIQHGEYGGAQLAVVKFVEAAMNVVFLLNNKHMPFYKWSFRALKELDVLFELAEPFCELISTGNEDGVAEDKYDTMEGIAGMIITELSIQGLTKADCGDLEKHAYSVNDGIEDPGIRNMHILAAV